MSFETPPPLIAAAQILYSITTESQGYKLTKVYAAVSSLLFRVSLYNYNTGELLVLYIHGSRYLGEEFWGAI